MYMIVQVRHKDRGNSIKDHTQSECYAVFSAWSMFSSLCLKCCCSICNANKLHIRDTYSACMLWCTCYTYTFMDVEHVAGLYAQHLISLRM